MVALASRIPSAALADRHQAKKVLKDALRPWLPTQLIDRPKQGFALPLSRWLGDDDQPFSVDNDGKVVGDLIDPSFAAELARPGAMANGHRTATMHNLAFLQRWLDVWDQ
jgi:asparagine synthetase B (glutamine-hydrolysing)